MNMQRGLPGFAQKRIEYIRQYKKIPRDARDFCVLKKKSSGCPLYSIGFKSGEMISSASVTA